MKDDLFEAYLERGVHAVDDIGNRIADEENIHSRFVGNYGTGIVVRGDHRDLRATLAITDLRNGHFVCHETLKATPRDHMGSLQRRAWFPPWSHPRCCG